MGKNILQIIACYFIGLIAGNFIFMLYAGPSVLSVAFTVGGAILALPILVLVILAFVILQQPILRNLSIWCSMAPFLIVFVWMAIEWKFNYSNRGQEIFWYLSLRNVWERAALAFVCAAIGCALFWRWNRPNAEHR